MNFDERLSFLIHDRKKTPWGKALGFTSPSITAMFSGHIPGPEFLNAIRRAENINLNWLLTGDGNPYIVEYYQAADELCSYIDAMLEDEPWLVYVCSYENIACLVLAQSGQYEFKSKIIDYTIVHIIVGPGDSSLTEVLSKHKENGRNVLVPLLTELERKNIINGQMGSYQLFHQTNPILNPLTIECGIEDIQFTGRTQEGHNLSIPTLRSVLRVTDELEISQGLELSIEQKARIVAVVYRQISRIDMDILPDQAIIAAVDAAFDMLVD